MGRNARKNNKSKRNSTSSLSKTTSDSNDNGIIDRSVASPKVETNIEATETLERISSNQNLTDIQISDKKKSDAEPIMSENGSSTVENIETLEIQHHELSYELIHSFKLSTNYTDTSVDEINVSHTDLLCQSEENLDKNNFSSEGNLDTASPQSAEAHSTEVKLQSKLQIIDKANYSGEMCDSVPIIIEDADSSVPTLQEIPIDTSTVENLESKPTLHAEAYSTTNTLNSISILVGDSTERTNNSEQIHITDVHSTAETPVYIGGSYSDREIFDIEPVHVSETYSENKPAPITETYSENKPVPITEINCVSETLKSEPRLTAETYLVAEIFESEKLLIDKNVPAFEMPNNEELLEEKPILAFEPYSTENISKGEPVLIERSYSETNISDEAQCIDETQSAEKDFKLESNNGSTITVENEVDKLPDIILESSLPLTEELNYNAQSSLNITSNLISSNENQTSSHDSVNVLQVNSNKRKKQMWEKCLEFVIAGHLCLFLFPCVAAYVLFTVLKNRLS